MKLNPILSRNGGVTGGGGYNGTHSGLLPWSSRLQSFSALCSVLKGHCRSIKLTIHRKWSRHLYSFKVLRNAWPRLLVSEHNFVPWTNPWNWNTRTLLLSLRSPPNVLLSIWKCNWWMWWSHGVSHEAETYTNQHAWYASQRPNANI